LSVMLFSLAIKANQLSASCLFLTAFILFIFAH
jgi:hypothetical protein